MDLWRNHIWAVRLHRLAAGAPPPYEDGRPQPQSVGLLAKQPGLARSGQGRAVAAPVTYNDWSSALRERYFVPENNGIPVTFFVDDDAIAEISGEASHEEAVRNFARRVHGQLIH